MKKVIGILGKNGAGKDTLCDIIKDNYSSVEVLKFSDALAEVLNIFFDEISRDNLSWLASTLREKFGDDILARGISKKIDKSDKKVIILNGIRVWDDFELLKEKKGKLIYITADEKIRWKRLQERGEKEDDNVNFQEFLEKEKAPTEIEIPKIGKRADFIIENNGSLEELREKTLEIIKKINGER